MFNQISIIIPAYNESKLIAQNVKKVEEFCKKNFKKYEIIVVDDGSKDNTVKNIPNNKNIIILENKINRGKGYSVKKGMLSSRYDPALFMDADLSTSLEDIIKFMQIQNKADIIIGSRDTKDANVTQYQPFFRRIGSKTLKGIATIILPIKVQDSQCGFKLFNKRAKKLFIKQKIIGFAFDMELLWLAKKYKLTVLEKGVTWKNNKDSKVNIIKDSIKFLIDAIKIRLRI
ncbi:glycosyltransferase [Candidatus Woesearchaeota archaeon]|nr:glycosyltransferase [Candidatus Woesearchaeota archaeon]